MTKIALKPTREQLDIWFHTSVPDKDLFFLREEDLSVVEESLAGTLVFPREEFFTHSSYKGVQMVSSYMYWTVAREMAFVIVATPQWLVRLNPEKRGFLLNRQVELCSGLTVPLSLLTNSSMIPEDYIVEKDGEQLAVIRRAMWGDLPREVKEEIISKPYQQYDSWSGQPIPATTPSHLLPYVNTFAAASGANCLAAVLYAISTYPEEDEWLIHEWVHPETFALQLKSASYVKTEDHFRATDVVVWVNEENVIQHAAYCIDGHLFFNKSGQVFTNPWKVIEWEELEQSWCHFTPVVYRK